MEFIVVESVPSDGRPNEPVMINVDAIRSIRQAKNDGCGAMILFNGHPDATLFVREDFDTLRNRLIDLELPMPCKGFRK